jgi:hypothetical protein
MKILWNIALVILAFIAGSLIMMPIEGISYALHPMPEGVKPGANEAFKQYVAGLPITAFILVWLSHFFGPLVAVFIAARFAAYRSLIPACVVGALYFAAGITNLLMIGHTGAFAVVDLLLYPTAFLLGTWLGKQKPAPAIAANTP